MILFLFFMILAVVSNGVGLILMLLTLAAWFGICHVRRVAFDPDIKILYVWPVTTVVLLPVLLIAFFFVPIRKSFDSPGGDYSVTLAFYPGFVDPLDHYRFVGKLRVVTSGKSLGKVKDTVRSVFIGRDGSDWDPRRIQVEWNKKRGNREKVRIIFVDMNTAYLLPGEEEVFPLSELKPPLGELSPN